MRATLRQLAYGLDGFVGRAEAKKLAKLHGHAWGELRKAIKRKRARGAAPGTWHPVPAAALEGLDRSTKPEQAEQAQPPGSLADAIEAAGRLAEQLNGGDK